MSSSPQKLNNSGEPLADIGLKWGKTPQSGDIDRAKRNHDLDNDVSSTAPLTKNANTKENDSQTTDWESFYTEDEKEKLRKKGINPALKAEMEDAKRKSEAKGLWGKLAQTAAGGGWVK